MKETVQALITMNLNFTITHVGSAPKPFPHASSETPINKPAKEIQKPI